MRRSKSKNIVKKDIIRNINNYFGSSVNFADRFLETTIDIILDQLNYSKKLKLLKYNRSIYQSTRNFMLISKMCQHFANFSSYFNFSGKIFLLARNEEFATRIEITREVRKMKFRFD